MEDTHEPVTVQNDIPKEKIPIKPQKNPTYKSIEWFKKHMPWAYQNL
jgi:hypothetical protein